jgi:hypothetical protein
MNATHIIYKAIGSPEPHETTGERIEPKGYGKPCAHCGAPGLYRLQDAISDNFTTVKNASRAWPFGGTDLCAACLMACKALQLRCVLWFARENGIWFTPTRPIIAKDADGKGHAIPGTRVDALAVLLNPPPVPFVAGYPRAGIEHGGEANIGRVYRPGHSMPERPLVKLQSKHTAIYAQISTSRDQYPLQIDDVHDVVVDVPVWSEARAICDALLRDLRAAGCGAQDCQAALKSLRPPPGAPLALVRDWPVRVASLRRHNGSLWWPFFLELLHMPALPDREKKAPKEAKTHATTRKAARPEVTPEDRNDNPPAASVPAPSNDDAGAKRKDHKSSLQLSLF